MFNFTVSNLNLVTVTIRSSRACSYRSEVSSSCSVGGELRGASWPCHTEKLVLGDVPSSRHLSKKKKRIRDGLDDEIC